MTFYVVSVDNVSLTASTAKTIIDLATTSSTPITIWHWWVEGWDPTATTNAAWLAQIGLFSAAVTTHTAVTPGTWDVSTGVSSVTAGVATTSEGAGTASNVENHRIQTAAALIPWEFPKGRVVPPSSFWRIKITPGSAVTNGVTAGVLFEE